MRVMIEKSLSGNEESSVIDGIESDNDVGIKKPFNVDIIVEFDMVVYMVLSKW